MKRAMLLGYLAAAERHITEGARNVARQREIVDELERHGRGNSETVKVAREFLQTYETAQAAHVAERLRFKQALQAATA